MRFEDSYIPGGLAWTSPFVRWQGSLSEVNSIDLAVDVTDAALKRADVDIADVTDLTFGITIPQPGIFYGAPTVAARLGAEQVTGPMIAQACATSVASLRWAASSVDLARQYGDPPPLNLVVTADRLSNGPHLVYPKPSNIGGYPTTEDWVLDNFKRDPWAGAPMIETAEAVAAEGGFTRGQVDEVCLQRYEQYAAHREKLTGPPPYIVPYEKDLGRGKRVSVADDEGVHPTTREGLAALKPVRPDGLITYGTQTHPADGSAGAVVTTAHRARTLSRDGVVTQLVASGVARAERARMPKATVPAARRALAYAGLEIDQIDLVVTHNPFAVNDLWFARETGFALEKMNLLGCSLVYGHPQAATGLRGIVELVEALRARGGGLGMFTGCAAGDTAASMIIKVTD